MNPKLEILERVGTAAALEQLAEEAAELAQSALKAARVLRGRNPTPVEFPAAFDSLKEEIGDVRLCVSVLESAEGWEFDTKEAEEKKLLRWQNRLNEFYGGGSNAACRGNMK